MANLIQIRRDPAAIWTAVNPILAEGEMGFETDTGKLKIGNGVDLWNVLPYMSGVTGATGPGSNWTIAPNVGLTLTSNTFSTLYNTTISDSTSSVQVGNAAPALASVWKTKTIVQVLDSILFNTNPAPPVATNPTYTVPTLTFSGTTNGTTVEVGTQITQNLTLTGTKNDAGPFGNLIITRTNSLGSSNLATSVTPTGVGAANLPTEFTFADPNNPNYYYQLQNQDVYTVIGGTTTWGGTGTYAAGLPKKDSANVNDARTPVLRSISAPQAAATSPMTATGSATVTGAYPWYWGLSSSPPTGASVAAQIASGAATKVFDGSQGNGLITIAFNGTGQWVWFAHVATLGFTPKAYWKNSSINQGTIGAGQFILAPVTQSVTGQGGGWTQNFLVYLGAYQTDTNDPTYPNYQFSSNPIP